MVLDRFDSVVFLGDKHMKTVFAGLNILLRKDLALGSLEISKLSSEDRETCCCENQFIRDSCVQHAITASDQISSGDTRPYMCSRIPITYIPVDGGPLPASAINSLKAYIPPAPKSNYRPIPIMLTVSPEQQPLQPSSSTTLATNALQSLLSLADSTGRKTPTLWIGPPAAGHLDISKSPTGNNNAEIWRFSREMDKIARDMDVEVLSMWNMTVQANSWDGKRFGEKVALVEAMMVVNWLSRLESS